MMSNVVIYIEITYFKSILWKNNLCRLPDKMHRKNKDFSNRGIHMAELFVVLWTNDVSNITILTCLKSSEFIQWN